MRQEVERVEGGLSPPRIAALGALAIVAVVVAFLLLTGGEDYRVKARFVAATQIVKGNVVHIGGRRAGSVKTIELTDDGQAELELAIDDEFAPLRRGTEAVLRLASLSSPSGRYVELMVPDGRVKEEIPDGGLIPATQTTSAIDLDQFFNLFDERTRKGLRKVIRGYATAYGGRGREQNAAWRYLNPSLVGAQRLFRELNRDTPLLERFLVESSQLVTDLADRRTDLAILVDRLATATGAIAREEQALSSAVARVPPFMRRANTTFVNLRATLDDLDPLVKEATPVAPKLRRVLNELRPFARDAVPTIRSLSELVRRPGRNNDLLELSQAVPPFRDIAIGPVNRNGAQRPGSFPAATASLRGQTPIWGMFRPYVVDFTGWLDDFSHSGAYDGNGSFSRIATGVNAFSATSGQLVPVPSELRPALFQQTVKMRQNNRCPGSIERGALWKPSPDFQCDETQTPQGR